MIRLFEKGEVNVQIKIEQILDSVLGQAHAYQGALKKVVREAEAVIPVLLDDKREHSAKRLQGAIDELRKQHNHMEEFGAEMAAQMTAPEDGPKTTPDPASEAYKASQAVEEAQLRKQAEGPKQEKAHAGHHQAD